MALALKDRVKETTIVVGTGTATLLGSSIGFQPFSVVGNGNTTYYCISDQFGSNWEVGIGTYTSAGNTLARTTVLASSNGGALVVFTAGVKDVFVTYPAEKGVWLDASGNAIGLGTPAAFVGTNITGTASGLTAGNVTTNANLSGAVSSIGNSTSLGSFTSAQLALAISDETGTGKAVFATNPTLTSPTYAGTLTGSTDILNIGSGQIYKDASGNVGIGTSSPSAGTKLAINGNAPEVGMVSSVAVSGGISLALSDNVNNSLYVKHVVGACATLGTDTGGQLAFASNGFTERMRIDSSGNVGIGTSSPSSRLEVLNGGDSIVTITGNTASGNFASVDFKRNAGTVNAAVRSQSIGGNDFGEMYFMTRSSAGSLTERMRIDSSGNVGIGVTPSAWSGGFNALEFLSGSIAFNNNTQLRLYQNCYYNGSNLVYKNTGAVSSYQLSAGAHIWYQAASGTAGSTIAFTQAMTLDTNGNLGIGTTTQVESCRLSLYGGLLGGLGFASSLGSNKYSVNIDSTGGLTTRKDSVDFWYLGRSGSANCVSSGGSWVNSSDERLKDNIETLPNALKNVLKLRGVSFMRKATQQQEIGVIAQEVKRIYPEVVEDSGDMLGVNYGALTGVLIEAIKELKAIIDTQQEQINSLAGK